MFESAELGHHLGREAYEAEVSALREALLDAQHELKERSAGPVVILINGMDGAGRSETLAQIDAWLDPRLVPVYAQTAMFADPVDEATGRPWLWRYWNALPPRGQIGVYFGSWYSDVLFGRVYGQITEQQALQALAESLMFEKQLAAEGASIVKFWLHLSKADQKNRLKSLEKDPATRWRVSERDWEHLKDYDAIRAEAERMLRATSIAESPWVVVEGLNTRYREITVGRTLLNVLKAGLEHNAKPVVHDDTPPLLPPVDGVMLLDTLQLDQPLDKSEYRVRLAELQSRLAQLTREAAFSDHSLLIAFEGNDAAGKGGAIRRLAMALDARRYRIIPVAAPTEEERAKPWLWRFWRHVPKRGGISIFDRTWYGRVLVERVEGFCREVDWMRAYNEINDFERQLHSAGAIVVKFWLTISKEEQLARFKAREDTGFKRFKITDEDWRNRDKWDDYKLAVCDMIDRTSTHHSPWTLVEANNKYYARIKVLETVCAAIEKRLAESARGKGKSKGK